MTTIFSPIQEINDLVIYEMPKNKPLTAEKVVRVGDVVVAVTKTGRIYAHGRGFNGKYSYTFAVWPWSDGLIKALAKAGIISKNAAQQHMKLAEERDKKRHSKQRAESFEFAAQQCEILLTPRQKARLAKMKGDSE